MTQIRYQPFVTVACIVASQGKYLLVEESPQGQIRYNQPAGHLEAEETLQQGVARELFEETGLTLAPDQLVGVYQFWTQERVQFVRFTFVIELPAPLPCSPQDPVIDRCLWLTLDEIKDRQAQLRSPLVLQCIEDWLNKGSINASMIQPCGLPDPVNSSQ